MTDVLIRRELCGKPLDDETVRRPFMTRRPHASICDWCGELNDPHGQPSQPCMCLRWALAHAPAQLRPQRVRLMSRRAA